MNIRELLPKLGILESDIESTLGNMDAPVDKGYDIKMQNICTGNAIQALTIQPNINWTDGSCRPAYGSLEYGVVVYLNRKMTI